MKYACFSLIGLLLLSVACQNPSPKQTKVKVVTLPSDPKEAESIPVRRDSIILKEKEEEKMKVLPEPVKAISSSKPVKPVVTYGSLNEVFESLRKPKQIFQGNASEDFTIQGNQGTHITFTANSFTDANGNTVSGMVEVELEEYYSTSDILSAKLTTSTKDKLLETGGMINLQVLSNGKACKLKSGQSVQLEFATSDMNNMQLFDGRRNTQGTMQWTAQQTEYVETYIGCGFYPEKKRKELVFLNNFIREVSREIYYPNTAAKRNIQGRVMVQFFIDKAGRIRRPQIVLSPDNALSKSVLYALNNYPQLRLDDYEFVPLNKSMILPVQFTFDEGQDLSSLLPDEETEKKIMATKIEMADGDGPPKAMGYGQIIQPTRQERVNLNRQVSRSILQSTSLGWINCDRFLKEEQSAQLIVNCNAPSSCEAIQYLIFKDIRSILSAYPRENGQVVFEKIPAGKEAILVAIRLEAGILKVAFKDIITTEIPEPIKNLTFESMSEKEFMQRLNGVGYGLVSMR
ncbi:MAG TPA: hypothetical protein DCG19_09485 [Cryomorphaceae bacterium]|nr:hypothetical protein [Owenweeksia sp.]HAD97627.1 hypothetical protein [Cryomorphaceae bacterium]HBF21177.1 hypothetical protein [Cryomorphaceae bacterium]|tara:strand:- start:10866 stop:12413 length:1548 start_codon:yes stop_codon:yes gene_type:complete